MNFRAENVHAGYVSGIDILRGLTIEARDGALTTIIGANGVGKSTLLKCAVGQLRPHTGSIRYGKHDLTKTETHDIVRMGVAYIAQRRNIFPHMSVLENIEMGLWSIRDDRRRCAEAIETLFQNAPIFSSTLIWGKILLRGLTIEARDGALTTIIGANGVGKSTLLKCAVGQLRPHTGSIRYGKHDLTKTETHDIVRMGVAYIAQRRNIFPHMSVLENIEMGLWSIRDDRRRCAEAIETLFQNAPILAEFRNRKAGDMSGGQQRLLEIRRALLTNPALMLVDEPTVGLDPKMTGVIYGFLRQLVEEEGRTILMVDQNVIAGTDVADFIYVLEQGANKFSCSKADFDSKYRASIADWLL